LNATILSTEEFFMKRCTHTLPLLSAAFFTSLFTINPASAADYNKAIEDALKFGDGGAIKFDANYRWENVNQDAGAGNPKTANANTIRTRIGVLSPKFYGFQGFAEYEGNHALQTDYNDTRGNNTGFSKIADPAQNELNQLWISYSNFDTVVKGGRQRIKLDDDRFIGNVGWRQMVQHQKCMTITICFTQQNGAFNKIMVIALSRMKQIVIM
jgi:hypothetical protein